MAHPFAGLLLLQIALVSPSGGLRAGDVLPADFGQWHASLSGKKVEKFSSVELGSFSPADAAVLEEFGFLAAERRAYQQADGKQVVVEALRMRDATAAFGAFTWYQRAGWDQDVSTSVDGRSFIAAVGSEEAVLQRNGFCVRVIGSKATHQELAQLAIALPSLENDPMPSIGDFLPREGMVRSSAKYAFGPVVLGKVAPAVPPANIGFTMGAEVISAEYRLNGRPPMTLLLALYPTPQIAQKYAKQLSDGNLPLNFKRTGTMISIVTGAPRKADADQLLNRVHYTMGVMLNQGVPKVTEATFMQMLMSIFALCGILLAFAATSGLLYGLLRVLARRHYPGQVFDRDVEVIELHLSR